MEVLASEQLSHIIVVPYSSRVVVGEDNELKSELSLPSTIALESALEVQKRNPEAKLIIPGETTYKGLQSTTDLMVERALEKPGVERDSLVPLHGLRGGKGRTLDNTYLQIRAAAEYLGGTHKSQGVEVIPFNFHLVRVARTVRGHGILANVVSAETVLKGANISKYDGVLPLLAEPRLEKSERFKDIIGGKRGRLYSILSRVSGPGLLDIIETVEGYELEEGLARTKHNELRRSLARSV